MVVVLKLLWGVLAARLKSRARLEAENLILRHQLNIAERHRRAEGRRVRLAGWDRLLLVSLHRLIPAILGALTVLQPATVVGWHRAGFRAYWRWTSRPRGGRPKIDAEYAALIRKMARDNPLWSAPRIHGELQKLGIEVAEKTVARYMPRYRRAPSPGWQAFLRNHADAVASLDLFVVPTVSFRLLYGLVILHHGRGEIVRVAVTAHPTAEWLARQVTEAFAWERAPRHLVRDNDGAYGKAFRKRVQALGIRDHPIPPRSPWRNGYVERVIGSIRRECLDHVIMLGEAHLRRVLFAYAAYYNEARTHLSLDKDAPLGRTAHAAGRIASLPILGGLHHQYVRI